LVLIDALSVRDVIPALAGRRGEEKAGVESFVCALQTPSVTRARLVSMIEGSVAAFSDIVMNLVAPARSASSSATTADTAPSWVESLCSKTDAECVLLGDDTWLSVTPPGTFAADSSHPVLSFFVSDTDAIDAAVTDRLDAPLARLAPAGNVSLLVAHYLGLDHVGHGLHRHQPSTDRKLLEYSRLVRHLRARLQPDTLLIVAGDHGADYQGGHGGSTREELTTQVHFVVSRESDDDEAGRVDVAALAHLHDLLRPLTASDEEETASHDAASTWPRMQQVDLATTVALALGVPVPSASLGLLVDAPWTLRGDAERLAVARRYAAARLAVADLDNGRRVQDEVLASRSGPSLLALMVPTLVATAIALTTSLHSQPPLQTMLTLAHAVTMFATSFIEAEPLFLRFLCTSVCLATVDLQGAVSLWAATAVAHGGGVLFTASASLDRAAASLASLVLLLLFAPHRLTLRRLATLIVGLSAVLAYHAHFFPLYAAWLAVVAAVTALSVGAPLPAVLVYGSLLSSSPRSALQLTLFSLASPSFPHPALLAATASWSVGTVTPSLASLDLTHLLAGSPVYSPIIGLIHFAITLLAPSLTVLLSTNLRTPPAALLAHRATVSAALALSCLILRNHLFVWSVLAPKLVFEVLSVLVVLLLTVGMSIVEKK
jgi:hypothetical protein